MLQMSNVIHYIPYYLRLLAGFLSLCQVLVVQNSIGTNPGLTLKETFRVHLGLMLIHLRTTVPRAIIFASKNIEIFFYAKYFYYFILQVVKYCNVIKTSH